ncbi:MAG: hypothetical protein QM223_06695 [Bacteroidota bacterium]|jgi:hypothetical protein|nr:hypothetical protein [Bacteroidota bacterium]
MNLSELEMKRVALMTMLLFLISVTETIKGEGVYDESLDFSESRELNRSFFLTFGEDTLAIKPKWFVPSYLKLQYAGLIGFASAGIGYDFTPRYEGTLYFGVLSRTFGGSSVNVQTLSYKSSWKLFKQHFRGDFVPKAGFSLNWGYTNNTFNKLPSYYPNKYYFQNKLHLAPFYGAEWQINTKGVLSGIGIYAEMSTLDAYLLEFIRTKYVTIDKIWNLCVGLSLYLD